MAVEHRFVETNGVRLHCAVDGDGPLVILLHGFPECWYSWRHQIAAWPDECVIRGTLGSIAAEVARQPIERTALILVGKVLRANDFRDSALYDPGYRRRFREATP